MKPTTKSLMQLGLMTAILPEMSLENIVQFASGVGYTCLEVMCWPPGKADRRYAGVTHIDVTSLTQEEVDRIKEYCAANGIEISALGYFANPLNPDPEVSGFHVEHIKKVILAAEMLGVPVVNTFVGRDQTQTIDHNWRRFLKVWAPIIKFAEDYGVKVAIENCPMLFSADEAPYGQNLAHTPAIWERMFNDIPSDSFGLCFDPSHLVWQFIDYRQAAEDFADRIISAHAKDATVNLAGLQQHGVLALPPEFHTPKLPGLGDVDWGRLLGVLGNAGFDGAVCVEVEDRVYEIDEASALAALSQSYKHLAQFFPG